METVLVISIFGFSNSFLPTLKISLPDVLTGRDSNYTNSSFILLPSKYLAMISSCAFEVISVIY
jgi:hypothetical protein